MRRTGPLDDVGAEWAGDRERLVAAARVLVVSSNGRAAEQVAAALRAGGLAAEVAAGIGAARAAVGQNPPDLRLVTFSGAEDPLGALLGGDGRGADRPAIALAASRGAAAEAVALGADDVLLAPFDPARAVVRVQARLRQAITVRLLERLGVELAAPGEGDADDAAGTLEAAFAAHRTWVEERGARLLLAHGEARALSQAVDMLAPLGHAVLTAESAEDVAEVLMVAGVDVAILHAGLPGGLGAAVQSLLENDPLLQVAVLETAGHEAAAEEALQAGAVTILRLPELSGPVACGVVQGLVGARRYLAIHERVVAELGRRHPEAVARWRAARGTGRTEAAPVRGADLFSDRRFDPRIPMELPVMVFTRDPAPAVLHGTTMNLSLGGAFIACDAVLRSGLAIECKVMVGTTTVYLEGAVVRAGDGSSAEGRLVPGFAVRFDRVSAGTTARLAAVVRSMTRRPA